MDAIVGILIGLVLALCVALLLVSRKRSGKPGGANVAVHHSIEEMRAIGELHVFRVVTKEIVTAKDHFFGKAGTKYFEWFLGSKKMAMIFSFDIDFTYNLQDPRFAMTSVPGERWSIHMPPCQHSIHIRDIEFYDEQKARLLPDILPKLIGELIGGGFGEQERNQLKNEAKEQAQVLALGMIGRVMLDARRSAEQTLKGIAKGVGINMVTFSYTPEGEDFKISGVQMSENALNISR